MLDGFEELQILPLAHDLVQLRGSHPGILHLLERSPCVNALMLGGVSNDQYPVCRFDLFEEGPHLPGAGEAGLVQHVEMWAGSVGAWMVLTSGEETLQCRGIDSSLSKLAGCTRCRSEAFDRIPVRFCAFPDARKHGGLP